MGMGIRNSKIASHKVKLFACMVLIVISMGTNVEFA